MFAYIAPAPRFAAVWSIVPGVFNPASAPSFFLALSHSLARIVS